MSCWLRTKLGEAHTITYTEQENRFGVVKNYAGHNSILSIQEFSGEPLMDYRLVHEDGLNAPNAVIFESEGTPKLCFDFRGLFISPEDWEKTKRAVEDMIALWEEYMASLE